MARSTSEEPGPGSQSSLHQANTGRIVQALLDEGPMTQAQLARRTSLAPSTVSGIVRKLNEAGLVHVDDEHGGRRGRQVALAAEGRVIVGIDVGHRHVTVAVADVNLAILGSRYAPLTAPHTSDAVLATARDLLHEILAEVGRTPASIVGAGLSVPAPLDLEGRLIGSRAILPGWADRDLAAAARQVFGFDVEAVNDANAGALAEARAGAGQGAGNLVYLKLGGGVGAGILINGKLYRGATGVAGEIGHTMVDERGRFCRCGNRGCLETVAGSEHLIEAVQPANPEVDTVAKLIEGARAGSPACVRVLADAASAVGIAVANLCSLVNPEVIVVGGELAAAGDLLLDPLRESVQRHGVASAVAGLRILPAALGPWTHRRGALVVALDAARGRLHNNVDTAGRVRVADK